MSLMAKYEKLLPSVTMKEETLDFDAYYCTMMALVDTIDSLESASEELKIKGTIDSIEAKYELTPDFTMADLDEMPAEALIDTGDVMLDCFNYGLDDLVRQKVVVYDDLKALSRSLKKYFRLLKEGRPEKRHEARQKVIDLERKIYNRLTTHLKRAKKTDTFRYNMSKSLTASIDDLIKRR